MDPPVGENYDDLCRLCASYDAIKMDIFSESGKQRRLVDKITTCLPFQVSENDSLPKALCYRCIYSLESFYDFRTVCISALEKLETALKSRLKENHKKNPEPPFPKPDSAETTRVKVEEVSTQVSESEVEEADQSNSHAGAAPESDGDDQPNPADFLEACLREPPQNGVRNDEDEGTFPCKTCGRLFNSRSSLTIHAKFHQDRGIPGRPSGQMGSDFRETFSCFVCEKVFSSKGHLALHSKVHIGGPPPNALQNRPLSSFIKLYHCDLCNKSYSMAKHLWGHVSTAHKGDPLVTCGICLRTFSSISNLEDHKRVKHANETVEQHLSNLTPNVQLTVPEGKEDIKEEASGDDKKGGSQEEASSNKRKSSKPRKIERESADPETNQEADDTLGSVKEEPEEQVDMDLVCPVCGLKFEERNTLNQHLIDSHGYVTPTEGLLDYYRSGESAYVESMMEAETVFYCEICIREFNDRASLWLHMLYSHREEASKACGICLKICPDNESLTQHVEENHPRDKTEQRRYSCQICARQHDSRKKLVTHARIHRLMDEFGNPIDPETVVVLNSDLYPAENSLHNTDGNRENSGVFPNCDICYKIFETDAKLAKHRRSVHRELSSGNSPLVYFACELCGLTNNSRTERWKHMSTVHAGDPLVTCELPECGKVFVMSSLKQEHTLNHHAQQGTFPNTCEVCGKMWKTRVEYWKHMMGVHADCLPYICGVCLKVFVNLQSLVNHVRELHWPLSGGEYCCDICGRPYSKASKMTRHRKIHYVPDVSPELSALLDSAKVSTETQHFLQQPSSYRCDQCTTGSVEFENLEDLGKHRKSVHSVMPCDLCTKYYGRTSHLWKHVNKIHKGHPDITCHLCQRTSASRSHLASHMVKHHRNEETNSSCRLSDITKFPNPVSCDKCSKVFRKESLAKKHMKHCKGPRPPPIPLPASVDGMYACTRCDRKFTAPNTLAKHLKSSHISYKCELCDQSLNNKTLWYNHVVEEHSDHPDVKCTYHDCGKILRCKTDLERHKKDHKHNIQLHLCVFCAELVTSKLKMKKHLKAMHPNETKYLCAACLKPLGTFKELRAHIEEKHSNILDRSFTCQVCCKTCPSRSKLIDHLKCHGTSFLPCKICLKTFSSKEELENHINNHPSDSGDEEEEEVARVEDLDPNSIMDIIGAPQGTDIEKKRPREDNDSESFLLKKRKREFSCILCPKIFTNLQDLSNHERDIHNDLRCDICGGMSLSESAYLRHKATCDGTNHHPNSKSILESALSESKDSSSTYESDNSFMQQLGLMPDMDKTKTKGIRKVYSDDFTASTCEICLKVWPAKRHLWQHLIRFHKTEAGTSCGVCLKYCPTYPSLSAHLISMHPSNFDGDGTNLTCKVCGKYHNARSKLHNHIGIHVGEEDRAQGAQHFCLFCHIKFASFRSLIEHTSKEHPDVHCSRKEASSEPIANGETKLPFHTCDICSLVFASEIGLANHRRIHENSATFKCGQCGQVLNNAEALIAHKNEKHRGAAFVCADCKSSFNSYHQLTEHNKKCKTKSKVEVAAMDVDESEGDDVEDDDEDEGVGDEEGDEDDEEDEDDETEDEASEEGDGESEGGEFEEIPRPQATTYPPSVRSEAGEESDLSEEDVDEEGVSEEDEDADAEEDDEEEEEGDDDEEEEDEQVSAVRHLQTQIKNIAYVNDDLVEVVRVDLDDNK